MSFRQHIETAVIVTVITVLIWLYAENKNVELYENEPIQVKFVTTDSDSLTVSPRTMQVRISFRGSSGQKQRLEQFKQKGAVPIEVGIREPVDPDSTMHQVQVVLTKELNDSPLGEAGIQVSETDPAVAEVSLRRMRTVSLPIEVTTGDVSVADEVRVDPETVQARMPASLARTASESAAIASLQRLNLDELEPNVSLTRRVPLALPPTLQGQEVELDPESVNATFTIRKRMATTTLTTVPIHLNVPPLVLDRFEITLPDDQLVLRNVELSGSANVIGKIESKAIKIWAELRPSAEQLTPGQTQLPVHLNTPPKVTVESRVPQVTVEVRRRP